MTLKGKLFFFFFLIISCNCNQKGEKQLKKNNVVIQSNINTSNPHLWESGKIVDTALYLGVGDVDTAIVLFYHQKVSEIDYNAVIEYCRLCQEEKKIFKLYREIFYQEKNLNEQLQKIKKTQNIIIDSTRRYVIEEFKTYGYFNDSPEVYWLLFRCKDQNLIEFVQQLLKSDKLSKIDKKKIKNDLSELGVK